MNLLSVIVAYSTTCLLQQLNLWAYKIAPPFPLKVNYLISTPSWDYNAEKPMKMKVKFECPFRTIFSLFCFTNQITNIKRI